MAGKTLDFNGKIKNFKAQAGEVTITVTADTEDVSLDELNEVSQAGSLSFGLEASQQELIDDEATGEVPDGQGELFDDTSDLNESANLGLVDDEHEQTSDD
ncbi:hypothetical protein OZX56_05350 [Lactobacillus sp. ESL0684]|uniref:hypothetical protein n=1 Tax=Lactobacillus sp. ESL0684 TaxID=2983213 RepID=UPI0023F9C10D|nr:hypothetical protein [Lactobacillus sp. ESL0684]WEV42975.1 hypothetical protein OZX56_05350 [Lactobacillus sp. ESL0684]